MKLIYALLDPDTSEVRYIGKTTNGLRRAKAHLWPSSRHGKTDRKNRWINSLVAKGKTPAICILAHYDDATDLYQAECDYIALYKHLGARLTNTTPGGESGPSMPGELHPMWGRTHTPEVKRRLSEAALGRRHSAETIEVCRLAAKRKHTKEHRDKIAGKRGRPITVISIETGVSCTFKSQNDAVRAGLGSTSGISKALKSGRVYRGSIWTRTEIANAA